MAAAAKAITELLRSHRCRLTDPCWMGSGARPVISTLPALFCWDPGSHAWTVTADRITLMRWTQLHIGSFQLRKVSLGPLTWWPFEDTQVETWFWFFFIFYHGPLSPVCSNLMEHAEKWLEKTWSSRKSGGASANRGLSQAARLLCQLGYHQPVNTVPVFFPHWVGFPGCWPCCWGRPGPAVSC